jgi:hypothetical protein
MQKMGIAPHQFELRNRLSVFGKDEIPSWVEHAPSHAVRRCVSPPQDASSTTRFPDFLEHGWVKAASQGKNKVWLERLRVFEDLPILSIRPIPEETLRDDPDSHLGK